MSIEWNLSRGIESAEAISAAQFIEALRPSNEHWWDGGVCPWVFRGHAYEDWSLLPSAWREDSVIMARCREEAGRRFDAMSPKQVLNWFWSPNYWSAAASFGQNDVQLARLLTIATTAEYIPIWDFVSICDDLGMSVPISGPGPDPAQYPNWLADATNPLVGDDLMRFSDMPAMLALAQHHGIPTRLLDWTRNPLAAAFFAVESLRVPEEEKRLVVWALNKRAVADMSIKGVEFPYAPQGAGSQDPSIVVVRPSTRDNPFLSAQAGLFTTISMSGIYFMKSGGLRPALETFVDEVNPDVAVLRKLSISHRHLADLLQVLSRERVARSALMPTLDNVARDVRAKWELSI